LIITHHPVIFEPLKNVLAGSVQYELIKNDIAVISMHTNLDVGVGGINDKLCEILGLGEISPVIASDGYMLKGGVISPISAKNFAQRIKEQIGGVVKYVDGKREIKSVLVCSGSGGDFIFDAVKFGFDALVTADIKHHHFLAAADNNISLFDGGHFNTEDIIVDVLAENLKKSFKEIEFNTFHSEAIKFA
jgi:dinuclear metal center YbgI/SA1388 family protein